MKPLPDICIFSVDEEGIKTLLYCASMYRRLVGSSRPPCVCMSTTSDSDLPPSARTCSGTTHTIVDIQWLIYTLGPNMLTCTPHRARSQVLLHYNRALKQIQPLHVPADTHAGFIRPPLRGCSLVEESLNSSTEDS